ncbi:MAG TPA: GTPase, partial [Enterovirga sp.]
LIGAETEAQRRQAVRQLQGLLGGRAETWRKQLIEAQALVEAGIDFPDEGDVAADVGEAARRTAAGLLREIDDTLRDSGRGERLRDGVTIAIAGPVNAGKSSLFNRLARRDAAIVSPHAGTTRDVLELRLDLAGFPVTVLDTAGMRESEDPVEREGVRRARARAAEADLVLWVTDAAGQTNEPAPAGAWKVHNKMDLRGVPARPERGPGEPTFAVSALEGTGLDRLVAALEQFSRETLAGAESALVTRARHRHLLTQAAEALQRGLAAPSEELFAEELRLAARALGRLVGRVDVEDVLDALFREFCIGK